MPLRLSVSHSRKTSENYCSTQHGLVIEAEVAEGIAPEALRAKVEELFAFAKQAVEDQIVSTTPSNNQQPVDPPQSRTPRIPTGSNGNGNGQRGNRRGQRVPATAAQIRAIKSIAAEQELDLAEVLAPYQVNGPEELTIRDASTTIDALKAKKANGNRR